MRLPKLNVIHDEVREPMSCREHDYCSDCALYKKNNGRCSGCTTAQHAVLDTGFQWCYQECHTCTGYKAQLTAICCRSPLKTMYLDAVTKGAKDWNQPDYHYRKRKLIKLKQRAIPHINFGSCRNITDGGKRELFPGAEAVAVSLQYVKGRRSGFHSKDLHDYLCLSKQTKIILLTMDIDDELEANWDQEFYGGDEYKEYGITYWMPLAFTASSTAAKMYNYYQFLRTQYATEQAQPHFHAGEYLGLGFDVEDLHQKATASIPNVIFNNQFLRKETLPQMLLALKRWKSIVPEKASFWSVGTVTPTIAHNLKRLADAYPLYFIGSKPLYMAHTGKRLKLDGNDERIPRHQAIDKWELLQENYETFKQIVATP